MSFTLLERGNKIDDANFLKRVEFATRMSAMNILNNSDSDVQSKHFAREAMRGTPAAFSLVAAYVLSRSDVPETAVNNTTAAADAALQPYVDAAIEAVKTGV